MPEEIKIEPLNYKSEADKLAAMQVMHEAFARFHASRGDLQNLTPMSERLSYLEEQRKLEEQNKCKTVVARINGRIVGCGFGNAITKENLPREIRPLLTSENYYFLVLMAVHPDFENRGVGKALTEARIAHARQLGIKNVLTSARLDNQRQLDRLKKIGFEEIYRDEKAKEPAAYFRKSLT